MQSSSNGGRGAVAQVNILASIDAGMWLVQGLRR